MSSASRPLPRARRSLPPRRTANSGRRPWRRGLGCRRRRFLLARARRLVPLLLLFRCRRCSLVSLRRRCRRCRSLRSPLSAAAAAAAAKQQRRRWDGAFDLLRRPVLLLQPRERKGACRPSGDGGASAARLRRRRGVPSPLLQLQPHPALLLLLPLLLLLHPPPHLLLPPPRLLRQQRGSSARSPGPAALCRAP